MIEPGKSERVPAPTAIPARAAASLPVALVGYVSTRRSPAAARERARSNLPADVTCLQVLATRMALWRDPAPGLRPARSGASEKARPSVQREQMLHSPI